MKTIMNAKQKKSKIDRLELLTLVDELGSISAAAKAIGVSYKAAWEAVERVNNMSAFPLLERKTGGDKGGGSTLTEQGRKFLNFMKKFDGEVQMFIKALGKDKADPALLTQYMNIIKFTTSARNQFGGRITVLNIGAVNSEIILDIGGGDQIVAIATNKSVESMGLAVGDEVYTLINASSIVIGSGAAAKTSARNHFTGTVSYCEPGAVNGEVIIELAGGKSVAAIITNESIKNLDLKVGDTASALFKASQVILAAV